MYCGNENLMDKLLRVKIRSFSHSVKYRQNHLKNINFKCFSETPDSIDTIVEYQKTVKALVTAVTQDHKQNTTNTSCIVLRVKVKRLISLPHVSALRH